MAVKAIPDGLHSVTPFLVVSGAAKLIAFLQQSFAAHELHCMIRPDGTVMHAEVRIGDSVVMMGEATGGCPPMPSTLYLYVPDADAVYQRALQAGATSTMEPTDQFWGDRMAGVEDPAGNRWWIATHQEDVSPEDLRQRAEACMQ
jgi:uncharacterized glyoxalase superfamily protein PhnB